MQEETKKWYKRWWAIVLFIFFTFFLIFAIAFGFWVSDLYKSIKADQISGPVLARELKKQEKFENIAGWGNHWAGAENPKLTIVVFIDFNCPLCANSYKKVREISLKHEKNVKIIIRDFPLRENSIMLAMAGRCAGEQDLFWSMHDKLLQHQGKYDPSSSFHIMEFANQTGANLSKFNECMVANKYLELIRRDVLVGEAAEIAGTPTWFFNGYKVEGDIPYDILMNLIDALLIEN